MGSLMTIRKTAPGDLGAVMEIFAGAREFMRENGNSQWSDGHPAQTLIESDIAAGDSYVCVENSEIAAVFYYKVENEPTYGKIDGAWLNNKPYGVVHRIAKRRGAKGAGEYCLNWSFAQCGNIRIDTHRDNAPMRRLLGKLGFRYCGIIWLPNGDERMAFQKISAD